ncbi:hypothetical protein H9P43_007807 [Blastocladiella emersonii ATCC 22665]|nr:hypothetical protein H9P43_007807 [Blastocladiella emersonii ATCC 22665]
MKASAMNLSRSASALSDSAIAHDVAAAKLRGVIDSQIRVTVTDGRCFQGLLRCTDRDRNLVLTDATEHSPGGKERYLNMILVPGAHIVKAELYDSLLEKANAAGQVAAQEAAEESA